MVSVIEVAGKYTPHAKAIMLDYVPSLIFQKRKLTNYRRNDPMYQLKCLAGCEFEPGILPSYLIPCQSPSGFLESLVPWWQAHLVQCSQIPYKFFAHVEQFFGCCFEDGILAK